MTYINDEFLLKNDISKKLFHEYSENLPIIDYHCHINPKEIYEDLKYDNITQVWLYGDHYKWRIMRTNGVTEDYVTGNKSDHDKFIKYAESLEMSIGNPLHHWSHIELKKYFDYDGILNSKTAEDVWNHCNEYIKENGLSVRQIINKSNVEVICTTDDPIDNLEWHKKIKEDITISYKVLPAFRPDKVINLEKEDYITYISKLEKVSGIEIKDLDSLEKAIVKRVEFFNANGCRVSDHGLDFIPFVVKPRESIDDIFKKRLNGEKISAMDMEAFKTYLLLFLGEMYKKYSWVMQLHYGCDRNVNDMAFDLHGPDTGYDTINSYTPSNKVNKLLDKINSSCGLPKTILYSLNPCDNAVIDSIINAFQDDGRGKIQHGSAWWFNDNKKGMEEQLTSLANIGSLGTFIGMLTDSRSFLSYTRHDYFRRILCNLVGNWVLNGEYPEDYETLEKIIKGISYYNAKQYFGF